MVEPKISVVMPVYNSSLFLKDSINSILAQSFPNFEFIIINDGSTDNSLELINSFLEGTRQKIFCHLNLIL